MDVKKFCDVHCTTIDQHHGDIHQPASLGEVHNSASRNWGEQSEMFTSAQCSRKKHFALYWCASTMYSNKVLFRAEAAIIQKDLKVSQTAPYSLIRRGINLRNGGHRFLLLFFSLPTNPFLRWGGASRVLPAFFHRPDMSFRTILALIDLRLFLLVRRRRNNRSYHGLRRTRDRCFQRLNATRQGPILL